MIALLVSTLTFAFAGGGDLDLVKAMESQTGYDFSLLADDERKWPKAVVGKEAKDDAEGLKLLGRRLGVEPVKGPRLGLSDSRWPRYFYFVQNRHLYGLHFKEGKHQVEDAGGLVTAHTADGPCPLAEAIPSQVRVSWHWFFSGALLWIRADKVPEADYVRMLAQSLGATVKARGTGYYLDFDPAAYLRRSTNLLDFLTANRMEDVHVVQDYEYTARVLQWMGESRIAKAMESQQPTFFPDPMPPDIRIAADARTRRWFLGEGGDSPPHPSTAAIWERVRNEKDFSRMTMVFYPKGSSAIQVPPLKAGGAYLVY